MKIELKRIRIADLVKKYKDNGEDGVSLHRKSVV